jgi:predicted nucleotidyltransferase
MILQNLHSANCIHPPRFLISNCAYLTQMGSVAYGVSGESSDIDIYGFCVPPRDLVFPHLNGEIPGFGKHIQRFEQWQEHGIKAPDGRDLTYDFSVYSIVKYVALCMDCNPNMIDSLFTPRRCVLHSTQIGELIRANRRLFLHKGAYHKFRGYAYAQLSKITNKVNSSNSSRAESIERWGYDIKFGYHLARLALECEQILVEGDLDLERNREQLKSIRRGEWTLERLTKWFEEKERTLESMYAHSTLQHSPDEDTIKNLLLTCLEMHYGSLSGVIQRNISVGKLVQDIQAVIDRYASEHSVSASASS